MILETNKILLRNCNKMDIEPFHHMCKNPKIGYGCGWLPHKTIEDTTSLVENIFSKDPYFFVIVLKDTNTQVGAITIKRKDQSKNCRSDDEIELGFWLGEDYWGKGIMKEAIELCVYYAFEKMDIKNIWVGAYTDNENSKKVQVKAGFKEDHIVLNYHVTLWDRYVKSHISLMTKEDYQQRKQQGLYSNYNIVIR